MKISSFLTKKMSHKIIFTATICALLLNSAALLAEDKIIATVNGQDISEIQLIIAANQSKINFKDLNPEQKILLTEALVNRQLVLEEALKANYDKTPDIVASMKALTESYIAANYLAVVAADIKIDEQSMKAYYDNNVLANTPKEFKARHILVKSEDEAKNIITDLEKGADFSKLAKEKSTDVGSGSLGGDLGWFSEQDMVAPFSKMVASLKKGELSKTAVKSQFGWHVIILDDIRSIKPPEYSAVKQNIESVLIKEKLNQYLEDLNKKATIVIK